jgi:hypothetical protein
VCYYAMPNQILLHLIILRTLVFNTWEFNGKCHYFYIIFCTINFSCFLLYSFSGYCIVASCCTLQSITILL